MKLSPKFAVALCIALVSSTGAWGAPAGEQASTVVASTSWTAAFAYAAGAESVSVLAPYDLRHPAEYELKPSDIRIIAEAEVVVFAGYENMVPRIKDAIGGDGPELLQIATDYSLDTIRKSLTAISKTLGTGEVAAENISRIAEAFAEWKRDLENRGLSGIEVITHVFQRPLAVELGLRVIGTFGPGPLEPKQLGDLSSTGARLIIDNWHNEVGRPFGDTMEGTPRAVFLNFPGDGGTITLLDVLAANRKILEDSL